MVIKSDKKCLKYSNLHVFSSLAYCIIYFSRFMALLLAIFDSRMSLSKISKYIFENLDVRVFKEQKLFLTCHWFLKKNSVWKDNLSCEILQTYYSFKTNHHLPQKTGDTVHLLLFWHVKQQASYFRKRTKSVLSKFSLFLPREHVV